MKTLPDYIDRRLNLLSIGLNPSLRSVEAGYYFATPQNRFWKALNASRLVDEQLQPGAASMKYLFHEYGIGFTDVVKRPTPGSAVLRAGDYRTWCPVLMDKIVEFEPWAAWFHGKVAYRNFLRYTGRGTMKVDWGAQPVILGRTSVFVTPNPSPANAAYSLAELTQWYDTLKAWLDRR